MKNICFLGDSLERLRAFSEQGRQQAGYQLHRVQNGLMPDDFKYMHTVGRGVVEIRIRDENGIYRVIYTARIGETVYVLHAFQKKTQKTAQADLNLAKARLKQLEQN